MFISTAVCAYIALCLRDVSAKRGCGRVKILYRLEAGGEVLVLLSKRREKERVADLERESVFSLQEDHPHGHQTA